MPSAEEDGSDLDHGKSAELMAVDGKSAEDSLNPSSLSDAKRRWVEAGWDIDEGLSVYPISPALREELLTGTVGQHSLSVQRCSEQEKSQRTEKVRAAVLYWSCDAAVALNGRCSMRGWGFKLCYNFFKLC